MSASAVPSHAQDERAAQNVVVDVHTHIYPPAYIEYLRSRTTVPYIRSFPDAPNPTQERLVILPSEEAAPSTSRGRPIGKEYWDIEEKLLFMRTHGIDMSILSLPNPWLDWVPSAEAAAKARSVNDDFVQMCKRAPEKLRAFATLPLSAPVAQIVEEIERIAGFEEMRGVIMGTSGIGKGLDDPELDPVWAALESSKKTVFLHPHYGLPNDVYGPRANDYGHVLPLALGVIEGQGADHRLPPAVLAHQRAGPVQADGDRGARLLELRQGVAPVLLLGQGRRRHRIGHVLDQATGHRPAMILLQVDLGPRRAELGVLVGEDLGEPGG